MLSHQPERLPPAATDSRILHLELRSSALLVEMKTFYHQLLGLPVVEENSSRISIAAGQTLITFIYSYEEGEKPFYHFALNIPENKILAAYQWLAARTRLLPIHETLRDSAYPVEVVNYSHWNAHAIFCFDPAGSVVELIARHGLKNAALGNFNSADILCVSEIALVVDDVASAALKLREVVGLGQYNGASDQFAAVGDENGLLIVMKHGRVISFAAAEQKSVRVYPITVYVRGDRQVTYQFPDFPYKVYVER